MNILMCSGFYDIGGFSIVMEKLATSLIDEGHDVTLGAFFFKSLPKEGAYDVVRIPLENFLKLKRFLDKFDVIHSHHAITNYLALVSSKPFVYHYHGSPSSGTSVFLRLSMIFSIKLMNHAFDAVISVSKMGALEMERYFGLGDVFVVNNGVNTQLFKPELAEKYRKGRPQFLFVGNLYAHKNVEEIIFSMVEILKSYPNAHLQIVGLGKKYCVLEKLVNSLNLSKNVDLVGRVSGSYLPYYYASCDVYVTASRWELFGLPVLEAIACGKPVIASAIPSHVEILNKTMSGEVYFLGKDDLSEKMMNVYNERAKYITDFKIFSDTFDWSSVVKKVLAIYSKICRN